MFKKGLLCLAALSALLSAPTFAAIGNGDFQAGLTGWSYQTDSNHDPFVVVNAEDVAPGFALSAMVQAGQAPDVYSTLSQSFSLTAGENFSGFARWIGFDSLNSPIRHNDDGYVNLYRVSSADSRTLVTQLFKGDIATYGSSPDITTPAMSDWIGFSFQANQSGTYLVEAAVRNVGDNTYNSALRVDFGVMAAVPEPQTEAMLLAGLGALGFMGRRRRTAEKRVARI